MKKFFSTILAMSILAMSCGLSAASSDGFQLSGTIKNAPNEAIFLEFLDMNQAQLLDTAKTDANGNFSIKGIMKEYGIVRIRLKDNTNWMFLMDNKNKVVINADRKDMINYTVTGGRGNELFLKALHQAVDIQTEVTAKNKEYVDMYNSGGDPVKANALKDSVNAQIKVFENNFKKMADTANSAVMAVYAASFINIDNDIDFAKRIVSRMEKMDSKSIYTVQFKQKVAEAETRVSQLKMQEELAKKTAVGSVPPDIKLPNPEGKEMSLSSLKGKVVLLDFWASWCGPCRKENPNVVNIYNKYKDKGFTVFSVSLDKSAEPWKAAIQQDGLIWPNHVSDLKGWGSSAAAMYGVQSIPRTFLIGADGKVIATNLRGEALENKVKEILEAK